MLFGKQNWPDVQRSGRTLRDPARRAEIRPDVLRSGRNRLEADLAGRISGDPAASPQHRPENREKAAGQGRAQRSWQFYLTEEKSMTLLKFASPMMDYPDEIGLLND